MNTTTKTLVLAGAIAFVLGGVVTASRRSAEDAAAAGTALAEASAVNAIYFHRAQRCTTCRTVEALCQEALTAQFAAEFDDGTVAFQAIDLDAAGNAHYAQDFALANQTLVLVRHDDPERFLRLDDVWALRTDRAALMAYVGDQTRRFLAGQM
jgi:hypothetical protein